MKQNKCNLLLYVHVFVPVRVCTCIWVHMWTYVCMCTSMCVSVSLFFHQYVVALHLTFWTRSLTEHAVHQLGYPCWLKSFHLSSPTWATVLRCLWACSKIWTQSLMVMQHAPYLESHFPCSITIWNLTTFTLLGQLQNSLFWSRSSFLSIFNL